MKPRRSSLMVPAPLSRYDPRRDVQVVSISLYTSHCVYVRRSPRPSRLDAQLPPTAVAIVRRRTRCESSDICLTTATPTSSASTIPILYTASIPIDHVSTMTTPNLVPQPLQAQHTGESVKSHSSAGHHQDRILSRRSSVVNAQIDTQTIGTPAPSGARPRMHKRSLTGQYAEGILCLATDEFAVPFTGNYYPNGDDPEKSTWPIGDEKVREGRCRVVHAFDPSFLDLEGCPCCR
jgi:hypothetical protein